MFSAFTSDVNLAVHQRAALTDQPDNLDTFARQTVQIQLGRGPADHLITFISIQQEPGIIDVNQLTAGGMPDPDGNRRPVEYAPETNLTIYSAHRTGDHAGQSLLRVRVTPVRIAMPISMTTAIIM